MKNIIMISINDNKKYQARLKLLDISYNYSKLIVSVNRYIVP